MSRADRLSTALSLPSALLWVSSGLLVGCPSPCGVGLPSDNLVQTGDYVQTTAEEQSSLTPFDGSAAPEPYTLSVTDDTVVLTYVDGEGRTVEVAYDVVPVTGE